MWALRRAVNIWPLSFGTLHTDHPRLLHALNKQPRPRGRDRPRCCNDSTDARPAKPTKMAAQFCRMCGNPLHLAIPPTEGLWRHVCTSCDYIDYMNPKLVVGCIVEHQDQILLCRRAIEPCRGLWTLPAGFLELNESAAEGAARETMEEAQAGVQDLRLFSFLDVPIIGQAYMLFRATLSGSFSAGAESSEVQLFDLPDIPWDQIAFSSISTALRLYCEDRKSGAAVVHHGQIQKQPGSAPGDHSSFRLLDHVTVGART